MMKKIIAGALAALFLGIATTVAVVMIMKSSLPKMITLADYKPLLVSEVYDRKGEKIGEFYREKRTLVEYKNIPKIVIDAFLAAEDSTFFEHGGINYFAIARAMLANLKAGEKVQGASTITQQVARSLLLSREKTYTRKIKEILLSYDMEKNLSKEDILYLYLNQIFLGQNSYGISEATRTYFDKELKDITIPEAAILAGLPKAPSTLNPIAYPTRAKERQLYVIGRLEALGKITAEEAEKARTEPVRIFMRRSFSENAPAYMDTLKEMLIERLGEDVVLDQGIRVQSSLDLAGQMAAQKQVQEGLRELDKRQGYRGPIGNTEDTAEIAKILLDTRNDLLDNVSPYKMMQADGKFPDYGPLNLTGFEVLPEGSTEQPKPLPVLPSYIPSGEIVKAVVTNVDDEWGLTTVRFAEARGLIDIETMKWARVPDPNVDSRWATEVEKPSAVLKKGDIILVRVIDGKFSSTRIEDKLKEKKKKEGKNYKPPETLPVFAEYAELNLEQKPQTEASLLAIDQRTDDIIAMVGGYEQQPGNLNRTYQTARQTGSAFKTLVYAAALDHGYTPATMIMDAPIVYEEEQEVDGSDSKEKIIKKWKPTNHSNHFQGDILFRNALVQSLNVPTIKIIEKVGVPVVTDYARRLGIFSPLNPDSTMALGSSSVSLYELTKAFAQIGRMGKRARPVLVHKVLDKDGNEILSSVYMDEHFQNQTKPFEENFEKRRQAYLAYAQNLDSKNGTVSVTPVENEQSSGQDQTAGETASTESAATTDATATDTTTTPDGQTVALRMPSPSKEPPLYFKDPDQLMKPDTAYVTTSLLQAVIEDENGTGGRARSLGRPAAGKTGTTNEYVDAWFIGYTADIATGVWVGYDQSKTIGKGEVGGRAALPIWVEYMKAAHGDLPSRSFPTPDGIVFASIDNETGRLASASSAEVVKQAFIAGTEPQELQDETGKSKEETQDFYKEDLSE